MRGPRPRRGLSLVEVLVVMVILVIGILAIARLFPQGFVSLNFTSDVTRSNALSKLAFDFATKFREYSAGQHRVPRSRPGEPQRDLRQARPASGKPARRAAGGAPRLQRPADRRPALLGRQLAPPRPGGAGEAAAAHRGAGRRDGLALPGPLRADLFGKRGRGERNPAVTVAARGVTVYGGTPLQRAVLFYGDPGAYPDPRRQTRTRTRSCGCSSSRTSRPRRIRKAVSSMKESLRPGLLYFAAVPYERQFKIEYTFHTNGGPPGAGQLPRSLVFTLPANQDRFALPNPAPGNPQIQIDPGRTSSTASTPNCRRARRS